MLCISVEAVPDLNVVYTTTSRLLAMIAASIFVMVTRHPQQYVVALLVSVLREGQGMFIDPFLPYANSPASPTVDFSIHFVIVVLEFAALTSLRKVGKKMAQI